MSCKHALASDRGSMSLLFVIAALGIMSLIGLIYDGGRAEASRSEAVAVASEAARAGAMQLDLAYLRATGITRLDPAAAQSAAAGWIAAAGQDGTVTATTSEVTVTVSIDHPTKLLGLIGFHAITVDAEAVARTRTGVTEPFGGTP
jgi:Flp pilus assembly protein TadG